MSNEDNAERMLDFVNAIKANKATSVYTLTYSTAARVVPAATAVAVATTGSSVGAATNANVYGFTTSAQADAIPVAINALEADNLALKKLVVALVNDLQAAGIVT